MKPKCLIDILYFSKYRNFSGGNFSLTLGIVCKNQTNNLNFRLSNKLFLCKCTSRWNFIYALHIDLYTLFWSFRHGPNSNLVILLEEIVNSLQTCGVLGQINLSDVQVGGKMFTKEHYLEIFRKAARYGGMCSKYTRWK